MNVPELAEKAGWDRSKVSRMETGNVPASDIEVVQYLIYCGLNLGGVKEVIDLCRVAEHDYHGYWLSPHPPGLSDSTLSLVYHESTASASIAYEPHLIPGLLQTEGYVRELTIAMGQEHDVERSVRLRVERQRVLSRPGPAQFEFFLHEHALRMMVGGSATMHEQLLALMLVDVLPHISVRVVPAAKGPRTLFGGPFRFLEYGKHSPLVYLDTYVGGLFMEDTKYVDSYSNVIPDLASVALNEDESREFLATLADNYDRAV